jgi:hypothetical protein
MCLVGLDFSVYRRITPAGAFAKKLNEFSNPSAVAFL